MHRNSIKEAILITRDWFTHFWWLIKEENFGKVYSQELKIMTGNYLNRSLESLDIERVYPFEHNFPCGSVLRKLPADAGNLGLIAASGRSPGKGNGNLLQDSCLGNPMNRGAWWASIHGVTKDSDTS